MKMTGEAAKGEKKQKKKQEPYAKQSRAKTMPFFRFATRSSPHTDNTIPYPSIPRRFHILRHGPPPLKNPTLSRLPPERTAEAKITSVKPQKTQAATSSPLKPSTTPRASQTRRQTD